MSEWRIVGNSRRSKCDTDALIRMGLVTSVCVAGFAVDGIARAADWNPTAALTVGATVSDNAFMAPRGQERSDIILRTMPTIGVHRDGPRLKLKASYAPIVLGYVNGTASDTIVNSLNATGNFEAIEDFFFLEARALVTQSSLSPLGVQSTGPASNSANRLESRTVTMSPYIQGRIPGGGSYRLRDDYSRQTYSTGGIGDTVTNRITASATDAPGTFVRFGGDASYTNVELGGFAATTSKIGRLSASFVTDPELTLAVNAGYEDNNYGQRTFSGGVFGTNVGWRPSQRTTFDVGYEKRYFGGSFNVNFQYSTRLASFKLRAYRAEQELQNRATGTQLLDTRTLLDSSLASRFPDSANRAREVERLMQAGGLPATLSTPTSFLSNRVNRVEAFEPSVAIAGTRSTLLFSVFVRQTTPLSDNLTGGVADVFTTTSRIRQTGMGLTVTHTLASDLSFLAGLDLIKTRGALIGASNGQDSESKQQSFRTSLTYTISPTTTATAMLRYTNVSSTAINDVRERAMTFTLAHTFR